MIPYPHQNDTIRTTPYPQQPDDASRMIPYPHQNYANRMIRHQQPNDAIRTSPYLQQPNDASKIAEYPQQPNDASRMIPYHQQPNDASRMIPYPHNNYANRMIRHQQPNDAIRTCPYPQQPNDASRMIPYPQQPNDARRMIPYPQQPNDASRMIPYPQQPNDARRMIPYPQQPNDASRMIPYPQQPNDTSRMVPHPQQPNDASRMIPYPHENYANRMIRHQQPNDAIRTSPYPQHPNDASIMVPYPQQPNDARRMIPYPQQPKDASRMIPYPQQPNNASRMIPYLHEYYANRMIRHQQPNDAIRTSPYPQQPNDARRIIPYPQQPKDASRMIRYPQQPNGASRMVPYPQQPNDARRMIPYPHENYANRMIQHQQPNDAIRTSPYPQQPNDASRMVPYPQQPNDANRMIQNHEEHDSRRKIQYPYLNDSQFHVELTCMGYRYAPAHPNLRYGTENPGRFNNTVLQSGRKGNGEHQTRTKMSLFFPKSSQPNSTPRPLLPHGRSNDDIHWRTSLRGQFANDSTRRAMSTMILDTKDMLLRTSLRISSINQQLLTVDRFNGPVPLQGSSTHLQGNNHVSKLFQYIYKSILSTMTVHSLDVHNAAAVVIARDYQVRLTAIMYRESHGDVSGEFQTVVQSMMSMDLMFNLHISKEALRPMSIIWNHDEQRQMNTKELFEIFWVTGLPAAERPRLGVAVCVIYGDPVAKLFSSDHTKHTHAESTMIDYLSRVLLSERVGEMYDPSTIIHVEVFQNYSPCGDCSKKYFLLFNEFAKFGLLVKITIHFVSLYKLYWDIAAPQGNLSWLSTEEHCYNRDWMLKLMEGGLDMYTFNEITWMKLLRALGMEVGRGIIPKYLGCGRFKADIRAAQMFNRLKETSVSEKSKNRRFVFLVSDRTNPFTRVEQSIKSQIYPQQPDDASRMIPYPHQNYENRMIRHQQPNDAIRTSPYSQQPNDASKMVSYPQQPNDASRMIPYPHQNDAIRTSPYPQQPNDTNRMIPYPHQNYANRMIPYPHQNDASRMIPYPRQNDASRMIRQQQQNDASRMILYPQQPNDASRMIPYPHQNYANRMIPYPHENDAKRMIPYPHQNDTVRTIPYPQQPNDASRMVPYPHQNDANRMIQYHEEQDSRRKIQYPYLNDAQFHAELTCMGYREVQSRQAPEHLRQNPNHFTGSNLRYGRMSHVDDRTGNPGRFNNTVVQSGRIGNGEHQTRTKMSLFFPKSSQPFNALHQNFAYQHPVPNSNLRPLLPHGRSNDDNHWRTSFRGHFANDSTRRAMSTIILDTKDMLLRTSLRISSINQHLLPVDGFNRSVALQGSSTSFQSNNHVSTLFQYIYKSILSTMAVHSLDVHNAAAVVIARDYQVRLTAIMTRESHGDVTGEFQTVVQSMMSMDLMFNLHISKEALRPMSIIWNHDEQRQMNTKELFEIFWVTGLPAAERPRLGVAVCVIFGDPVAKLFSSDHTRHTHAESTMIDYLSRVLLSERVGEMYDPSTIIHVEVFQNYSPCGDCSKKYCLLFNDFAKFGLRVKITIHFVSLYKLYWDIAAPQGNLSWLSTEEHCYNRDLMLKLMEGGLAMYTFNEITWMTLLRALEMEVGRGIIPKYLGCGRLKADISAAQMFNRLKEFGATRCPPNGVVASFNRLAVNGPTYYSPT